ncbi:phage tail spike protein [Sporolactobacillus terrae]|uniref:Pectate lyase superfamily protein domain-containing protein n=1 Tax=Sporolactobacillus terrae TaxID=269673 RepID=A0A5K7X3D4_9BACL|nr:phage tail spike protein [Sporolactobacillus terrae]BBN99153.1 hypothetical protein St703_18580 [Sporolactobacillus terrae]
MIPILYTSDETDFGHHGIGDLADCISAHVIEQRNGKFELEFVYPVTGRWFDQIQEDCIVKAKPNDIAADQLFRIYQSTKPMDGKVTFNARHISYDLAYNPLPKTTLSGNAAAVLNQILEGGLNAHPFTGFSDSTTESNSEVGPCTVREALGGKEGSLLDNWGGEYEFDNFTVRHHMRRGRDTGVLVEYGKNLTDFNQERALADVFTSVYAYAKKQDDEGNEQLITLDNKMVHLDSENNYPIKRTLMLDLSGDDSVTDSASLKTATEKYAQDNKIDQPSVSWSIKFQNLRKTQDYKDIAVLETCSLCDYITVRFRRYGVDVKAEIIEVDYNVLLEEYNSMDLGDPISNFVVDYQKQQKHNQTQFDRNTNFFLDAIDRATKAITGASGGYVRLIPSRNPQEIVIMDTSDIATATRVWRWNLGGLGYSHNGYNGPYELAMTMDGEIVADFITAGVLRGIEVNGVTVNGSTVNGTTINGGNINGAALHINNNDMDIWLDNNGFHMKKDDFDVWIDGNGIRAIKSGQEKMRIAQDGTVYFYDANIIGRHIKITPETIEITGTEDATDKTVLREGGLHFYKENSYLGNLIPLYSGVNSQKGISLNLENADFLSFDEPNGAGGYTPLFETLRVPVDGKARSLHGYLPFDMHNNPIKDNMGAYINAIAYGADPTGTKMSADAIQKALDKCRYVGSGTVYLPTGTYKLEKTLYIYASTKLLLDDNARMVRCHKMSCMLVNGGQNGEFADVTGYDGPGGIEIVGGYWDNNLGDSQYQDNQNDMFILGHGANIWVEKVKFIDCISYHCIDMNGCCHVRIRDCGFFGYHDYTTEGVMREAIQIGECNFAEFGVNDFTPCFDVIVEGCLFTKSSKQGYFPAGVGNHYSRNGVRQTDIVVRNNYFEGCTHSGTHPYKWGTTWIYQNTYINCKRAVHCSNVNGGDVSAQNPDGSPSGQPGACENIYIFDNDMIDCQSDNVYTSGFIYNGIYAQPRNIVIERNRITGKSGNTGLSLTLVQDTKIRKNAFKFLYRGIWLNSCDKTEVDDNSFESVERECVAADLDSNQTEFNNRFLFVRRNRMFNIGYSAVYMRTTWHGAVSDNEMFDVASAGGTRGGVAIESSDSIRVLNNSIDVKLNGSDQFSVSIGQGSTGCQSSNNRVNVKQVVNPNGGNFIGRFGVDGNGNLVKMSDVQA